jgi:hypothetical protein
LPFRYGIHFDTGEWDVITVFPVKGGPAELAIANSPGDARWMAQMVKLAGSQDAAKKLIAEICLSGCDVGQT